MCHSRTQKHPVTTKGVLCWVLCKLTQAAPARSGLWHKTASPYTLACCSLQLESPPDFFFLVHCLAHTPLGNNFCLQRPPNTMQPGHFCPSCLAIDTSSYVSQTLTCRIRLQNALTVWGSWIIIKIFSSSRRYNKRPCLIPVVQGLTSAIPSAQPPSVSHRAADTNSPLSTPEDEIVRGLTGAHGAPSPTLLGAAGAAPASAGLGEEDPRSPKNPRFLFLIQEASCPCTSPSCLAP